MNFLTIIIILSAIYILYNYFKKQSVAAKVTNYTAEEVAKKKKELNVVLLDVRTDTERKSKFIKGSIHIPLNKLSQRISELNKYKNKEIICYCQSGSRSVAAADFLTKKGFNASNMQGGISNWDF